MLRYVDIETCLCETHDCDWKIPIAYSSPVKFDQNRRSEFSSHSHESRTKKSQCRRNFVHSSTQIGLFCIKVLFNYLTKTIGPIPF